MKRDGTWVVVAGRPNCDIHQMVEHQRVEALYDGKTTHGPWANMCQVCFEAVGVGLGTGRGQRLLLASEMEETEDNPPTDADIRRDLQAAVEAGDFDLAEDILGDRDIAEFM